jgi:phosphotransferase system  glucose/maltose/N-acetylglucosamine-specific IIC component
VLNRAPDAVKEGTGKAAEKTGWNWWWIPLGIALAALLAGLLRMLTRRKHVEVAAQRAPDVTTTRVVTDPKRKDVVTDPTHKDDRRNH